MENFKGFTREKLLEGMDNIPQGMKNEARWVPFTLTWNSSGRWDKIPVYETPGKYYPFKFYGKTNDRNPLTLDKCLEFEQARDLYYKRLDHLWYRKEDNVRQTIELYGLAFYMPGSKFSCIDIDYRYKAELIDDKYQWVKSGRCIDEQGNISPAAKELFQYVGGWGEYSVSKTGIHIWYKGKSPLEEGTFKFTYEGETIGGEWYDGDSPDNQIVALTGDYSVMGELL